MNNNREKLLITLDQAAEITMLSDPDETGVIDKLFAVFRDFNALLEKSEYKNLLGYCGGLVRFLDKAAEENNDHPMAFKVCVEAIVAFQNIIRDGRAVDEIAFPVEISSHTNIPREALDETGADTPIAVDLTHDNMNNPPDSENKPERRDTPEMNTENTAGTTEQPANHGNAPLDSMAGKYLTFQLGNEEYGLEILKVKEIIKMMEITKVPKTPVFVRGVINLRGKVIPVIDLRIKFGMPTVDTTEKTCIIVVQVSRESGKITMGIIVDEVSEVLNIQAENIEPTPEFGTSVDTAFILGMGKLEKKVVMLLDVDKVLSKGDLETIKSV